MWIIDYLRDNASRVVSIISTYYWLIINAARFALDWAISQAQKALNDAIAWASVAIEVAKVVLGWAIDNTRNFLLGVIDSVRSWVWGFVTAVKGELIEIIDWTRNFGIAWVEGVKQELINIINATSAALDQMFRLMLDWALEPYRWLVENRTNILNIIGFWHPTNLAKVAQIMLIDFAAIINAVKNPVGIFIAIARQFILALLEWSLAYALGTVKANLPPWPDWLQAGYGGDIVPGLPAPIPVGALIAPLESLHISGHRYGPGHPALDLACGRNDAVFAMHTGIVEESRFSDVGYGWNVTLRNPTFWTRYAHLLGPGPDVGERVVAGDIIGRCDSTGDSTGDHLHLEIKKNGKFINPATVLGLS